MVSRLFIFNLPNMKIIKKRSLLLLLICFAIPAHAGFLTGLFEKMAAEQKKIDYAKSHSPIKTRTYQKYHTTMCSPAGIENHDSEGNINISFYSNDVVKFGDCYFLLSEKKANDGSSIYQLESSNKSHNDVVLCISTDHNSICYAFRISHLNILIQDYYKSGNYNGTQHNNHSNGSISFNTPPSAYSSNKESYKSSKRQCSFCNGTGRGADQITFSTNYTGYDNSRYCSTCGRVMDAHTHHKPLCRTCNGKGYIEY